MISPTLNPKETLRIYCDWLLAHQLPDGAFSHTSRVWYGISYALRTLIVGYKIFGEGKYLTAVTKSLDRLIEEQLPNGAWITAFRNKPTNQLTETEIEQLMKGTANTADIGSIAVCPLSIYSALNEERKRLYLRAVKDFADKWASQFILPSGAFSNGLWHGKMLLFPYSVATGTQAMLFSGLYGVTEDERYIEITSRAIEFQLDHWLEDGRPVHFRHDRDDSFPQEVTEYGDIYYLLEGMMWVYFYSKEVKLKKKILRVLGWFLEGERGLLKQWREVWFETDPPIKRERSVWFDDLPPVNGYTIGVSIGRDWSNPKSAGLLPALMLYYREVRKDKSIKDIIEKGIEFLCTPRYAEHIGVMVNPKLPWGKYSVQATGFAGLSLAEYIKPSVSFAMKE